MVPRGKGELPKHEDLSLHNQHKCKTSGAWKLSHGGMETGGCPALTNKDGGNRLKKVPTFTYGLSTGSKHGESTCIHAHTPLCSSLTTSFHDFYPFTCLALKEMCCLKVWRGTSNVLQIKVLFENLQENCYLKQSCDKYFIKASLLFTCK